MANSIVLENQLQGSPDTQWDLSGPAATNIEGFATDISVNRGQTVNFKISTDSNNYRIDIYRLGYYAGLGARKMATLQQTTASNQPAPFTDTSIGLVDAGNWSVTASWAVPATAVSGVYIAHLVRQDSTSGESHIPFVVRDDGDQHDIVFQTSDTTWHAYNGWGGYSLYGGGATASSDGRAYKVSYNRPIATRDGVGTYAGPQDFVFGEEIAAIHWLEANGYDVCYLAGVDTDRRGSELLNHKIYLSVGHDEYWSGNQRANVEAARAAGVHLAFWSGNEVFWKTRYESSTVTTDGSPTAYRTLVCYKETRDDTKLDPDDPPTWTGTWRDPRFSPPADGGRPENALTGTIFMVDDFREDQILIPYPMTKLRFWRNTAVAQTAPGNSGALVKNYLGYEWDESPDNGFRPPGLIHLSATTLAVNTYLLDYGHTEGPAFATHSLSLYRDPTKGAIVFGAGTVMWSWGLDADHDPEPKDPTPTPTDPNVKQAMVNLLADMGVFAQTLQSGLVPATQSTDTTAPTSTITSPANGASLAQNQTVTITGTAADSGGQVGGVEVSTDGGTTWHPATGTTSWNYCWTPATTGSVTIQARAVDDSLNVESPGPSISVTVTAAAGTCLFSDNDTPFTLAVSDPNAVELGVQFQSSVAGTITAIRFYKGPENTGTHVGNLWSAKGTLLASATFSNETATGWQQVSFSNPVPITANTIYVASYHCQGNYSADDEYFETSGVTNGPLTAPVTGSVGGNGVYAYGANSVFPTNSYAGTNYWVDVVFNSPSSPPPPTGSSLFSASATPATVTENDPNALELGVKFQSSVAGTISAIRFYKGSQNTGTHVGNLWNASGTLLGTATFSNETASGWQQVNLPSPVSITPGATYIVSYHTNVGFYSVDDNYFTSALTNGPLTAPSSSSSGGNGVFAYSGSSVFPTNTYSASNYWVDVVFNPSSAPTTSSLFSASATPATATENDPNPVELGVKFQSSAAGKITAIRFYKGPQNTGTHVGNLWSASGTLLATATFSNESGSGWQQVSLSTPISITPGATYIVSYHTNVGFYSGNENYFTSALTNGPLTAPSSSSSGGNGVYAYSGTSVFPTNTYLASNYWVDIVFNAS